MSLDGGPLGLSIAEVAGTELRLTSSSTKNFQTSHQTMATSSMKANTPTNPFDFQAVDVPIGKILLDPNNYRFWDQKKFKKNVVTRFHEERVQSATLEKLERDYQLDELKNSIITNGYVPMERVILAPYKYEAGYYVVIEGNRRIASLKSLLKESNEGVLVLSTDQKRSFSKIP
ncbi:MAG: hypothetical protein JO370_17690, partial [Paucibacter sp.]|nr:hypothetical protein [Roseateles sp.]